MQILILGAGGVGGYLGIRMIEAGQNVHFLVRPERAAMLRNDGLQLESALGNWQGHPTFITSEEINSAADLIIFACKANDLDSALSAVAPAIDQNSIIIPFLNGIRHLDIIRSRFIGTPVWGGVAHVGVTTCGPNKINHLNSISTFLFGDLNGATAPQKITSMVDQLKSSPATVEVRPDIRQDMWDKFVFLATLAGMTCLMRADIGTIMSTNQGKAHIEQLLAECSAIAGAEGFPPNPAALARYHAQLTEPNSTSTASMLRDIHAARPVEGDHILGDLVARAATRNIDVPLLSICRTHVETYERSRCAA